MAQTDVRDFQRQADRTRQELDAKLDELQDRLGDMLDLRENMARRPWATMAVALGVGAVIGYLVAPRRPEPRPWEPEQIRKRIQPDRVGGEEVGLMAMALPILNQAARVGFQYLMNRSRRGRESEAEYRRGRRR